MDKAYAKHKNLSVVEPEIKVEREEKKNTSYDKNDAYNLFCQEISQYPVLKSEEEKYWFRMYYTGRTDAKDKLVRHNLRLVRNIAIRHYNKLSKEKQEHISLMDLVQEGTIGLIKAIEKFDLSKGIKLSTYATWWINQVVFRYKYQNSAMIYLPEHWRSKIKKFFEKKNEFFDQNRREPTNEELAEIMEVTPKKIEEFEKALRSQSTSSLDAEYNLNKDTSLIQFTADPHALNPIEETTKSRSSEDLLSLLNNVLTEREKEVIILRYGLQDGSRRTLAEIGKKYNLTREAIRRIENKAKEKLKEHKQELEDILSLIEEP